MTFTHDLIVIGAGPAGLAAAATGADLGLRTLLLDEQPRAGGQIYRNVTVATRRLHGLLGADYSRGGSLAESVVVTGAEVRHDTLVWDVSPDLVVTGSRGGQSFQVRAPQLVVATGAMERASPLPGWTLPGVLNAGAAQIALKSGGLVPEGRVVVTGAGPLLLLVACQLLEAGVELAGLVETAPAANRRTALRHLPAALHAPSYFAKGLRMIVRLRRAGVPWYTGATELEVTGTDRATGLAFDVGGRRLHLAANTVLLHHGVIPNTQLSRLLRVDHRWSNSQLAWHVVADEFGQTSLSGLRVAGDGVAIAGARAAEAGGALAALGAAHSIGRLSPTERDRLAAPHQKVLRGECAVRPFLDALYRPPPYILAPADETIVCRCEEVSAGRIREMARLGCQGPNQTKFFSRCGMGPCQGRVCGNIVTQLLAAELAKPPHAVGAYRIRAPIKPIPVGSLANLQEMADSVVAKPHESTMAKSSE
ncbi:MAG: FAD-dependent oxidoreductase [Burkholderiales bacterium]|nr:FAD-dependent oxidoreductase [Burkholderiales bacterium]